MAERQGNRLQPYALRFESGWPFHIKDKLHQWLERGVSAATYIITIMSVNFGVMLILNGEGWVIVTGTALGLAGAAAMFAYFTRRPRLAQIALIVSFLGWLYLCVYAVSSGMIVALIAITIPNALLFAFYSLAIMHDRFWGRT